MSLEGVFKSHFNDALSTAFKAGVRGAFVDGCTFGVANAVIYLSEALLFFVGALFMANGIYSYAQMLQVLNLVVFTVTIASQLLAFGTCSSVIASINSDTPHQSNVSARQPKPHMPLREYSI